MNKLRWACLIGTAFEFFEFQIFAMLMPFLVQHFFNGDMQSSHQYLIGYLAFGVAFFARPLGGILLGHISDHYGRRASLLVSMWLMAVSTLLIGLLPSYTMIGIMSCILLLICRVGQGLSLGGEYANGSVFLFEHQTFPKCRDLIWQDLGGTTGLFFATLIVMATTFLFSKETMQSFAWRLPFFAAFILCLCGIYVRKSLTHPQSHDTLLKQNRERSVVEYYRQTIREWPTLLLLTLACAPNGVFWYLHVIFIPNQILHVTTNHLLMLICLTLFTIPLGAHLADRFGVYRIWILSVMGLVLNFIFLILSDNKNLQMIGMVCESILLSINQGPRLYILNLNFPLATRAISCSFVYSLANIFGGMTPFIALWLMNGEKNFQSLNIVLIIFCGLAMMAMSIMKRNFVIPRFMRGIHLSIAEISKFKMDPADKPQDDK